jgi:hypothetical protein
MTDDPEYREKPQHFGEMEPIGASVRDRDGDIWREVAPGVYRLDDLWPVDMLPEESLAELERKRGPLTPADPVGGGRKALTSTNVRETVLGMSVEERSDLLSFIAGYAPDVVRRALQARGG